MLKKGFVAVIIVLAGLSSFLQAENINRLIESVKRAAENTAWANKALVCYNVPAISSVRRLPDTVPADGKISDQLDVIAAQGEFEPASFVVFPFGNIATLELKISDLQGDKATIPASAIDAKVVKCWYQGGTAWHSYFADNDGKVLTPELLLNDENLIKVDHQSKDNYLRVDYPNGSQYVWVSFPKRVDPKPQNVRVYNHFNHAVEPVADSRTLKAVKLDRGKSKQFWLTVKVPEKAEPGIYHGDITLLGNGEKIGTMKLNLRVLPFSLPSPKTYYDLDKDFYSLLYHDCFIKNYLKMNGGDFKQAEKKLRAELENMRDHNITTYTGREYDVGYHDAFVRELELQKEVGMRTKPLFGWLRGIYGMILGIRKGVQPTKCQMNNFHQTVDGTLKTIKDVMGHHDVYAFGWDEPSMSILRAERGVFKYIHSKGANIINTAKDKHLKLAGYNEDIFNYSGWPKPESARNVHAMGGRIMNYAGPHTGPENPDYIRRTHGLQLYKADYDGTANYKYYEASGNIWNDFNGKHQFRTFNLVYPTKDSVIDTIAWEGLREGLDDIRYATKLRQLAFEAIQSKNVDWRYTGKKALQWLMNFDEKAGDLSTARMEMIDYILKLQQMMKVKQ